MSHIEEIYGLPPHVIENVATLCNNCKVRIKKGKKYTTVDYITGAHHGNSCHVLFVFIIQTIEINSQPMIYSYFPENRN
jgi:hypothetical protein